MQQFDPFYRLRQLYGPTGIFRVSRTKLFEDFLVRPGKSKLIPGTTVERLETVPLGEQAVAVTGAEVRRVAEALSNQLAGEPRSSIPRVRSSVRR
jgi:hypothetical protein